MVARRKRPKPGDIAKVSVDGGAAYLYYVGKHPEYGDTIRVLGSASPASSSSELEMALSKSYVAFYPLTAAVSQGLAELVAHQDANVAMPSRLKRPGARAPDGEILTWVIEGDGKPKVTKTLSASERSLPIAVIWSHDVLCACIRERWRPEDGL